MIDFGLGKIVPFDEIIDELIELVSPHARELGCLAEVQTARSILSEGTSSQRQTSVFNKAINEGADNEEALKQVVRTLVAEFGQDL